MKKWSNLYFQTFRSARLLTQIVSFSLAVMLVIDSKVFIYGIWRADNISAEMFNSILKTFSLEIFVAILFGSRFLLMFSERKTYFWFSQFIWIFSIGFLLSQAVSTEFGNCAKNVFGMFGETLSYLLVAYLLLSPLYQLIILIVSFSKSSTNKCLTQS